ncbi:MAG: hypothetical protein ACI9KE_004797 [Polyangiales bacterium]|jgi:hypothetical protein
MGVVPHYSRIQGGLYSAGWMLEYETVVVSGLDASPNTKLTLICRRADTCDCSPLLILGDERFAFQTEEHEGEETYFGLVLNQSRLQRLSCGANSSLLMCAEEYFEMDWLRANLSGHLQGVTNALSIGQQALDAIQTSSIQVPILPVCMDVERD